jgi:hypothetical protein
MTPSEAWRWAGREWRDHVRTTTVRGIAGAEIESPDPAALARRWGEVLARPPEQRPGGPVEIELDGGLLRFVPERGRGEGLSALLLEAADRDRAGRSLELGGVRVDLV